MVYIALVLGVFAWAGASGTRVLGDGKEVFEPDGKQETNRSGARGHYYRSSRFYHK